MLSAEKFVEELNKPSQTKNLKGGWDAICNGIKKNKNLKTMVLKSVNELLTDKKLKKDQIKKILESKG